jgi:hypothetical protein
MTSPYDHVPSIIVIDDERMIPGAENYQNNEALVRLVKLWDADLAPDTIYLDHDMGPDNNIWDIVSFFEKLSRINDPLYVYTAFRVHSMNPVGANKVYEALKNAKWPYVSRIGLPDDMIIQG